MKKFIALAALVLVSMVTTTMYKRVAHNVVQTAKPKETQNAPA